MASEGVNALAAAALVASCAILLVLLLRGPVRAVFGSSVAYLLWLLAPASLVALLLPVQEVRGPVIAASLSLEMLWSWAVGALICLVSLTRQQSRFARSLGALKQDHQVFRSAGSAGCPAVVGLLRPKIVVPHDFDSRYTPLERELIIAHERMHLRRGDLIVNAALAVTRCVFWFNPLVHFAARLVRFDQELACDESVLAHFPTSRKAYASAMLKTQLADGALPLGCHWSSMHPLKARILLLQRFSARGARRVIGHLFIAALVVSVIYGTWRDHQFWA